MDGTRFDDLVKGISSKRLTRLSAIRGMAVGAAAAVTGVTFFSEATEAAKGSGPKSNPTRKKKTICHCQNASVTTCFTKRMRPKSAKKHLKHGCDYEGSCQGRSGCPATATGGGPQPAGPCSGPGDCAATGLPCCIEGSCAPYACGEVCVLGPTQHCCDDDVVCETPCVDGNCPGDTCSGYSCSNDYECDAYGHGCECRDKDEYGYGACSTKGHE